MKPENAYKRVSVESKDQFTEVVKTPSVELVYLDAGFFSGEDYTELVRLCHKGTGGIGKLCGLRLPRIFRTEAEAFFDRRKEEIRKAGFDCFLVPNLEGALWLSEEGLAEDGSGIVLDHSVYDFNSLTSAEIERITGFRHFTGTCSLELGGKELAACSGSHQKELVVYGRVPMMVTAQCIRRTSLRCDRRMGKMFLRDRTGALNPVKNCCPFCYNTIYNSVPTVIADLKEEIGEISPDFIRYEFTTETPEEIRKILGGEMPKNYTRGHFHKGVL